MHVCSRANKHIHSLTKLHSHLHRQSPPLHRIQALVPEAIAQGPVFWPHLLLPFPSYPGILIRVISKELRKVDHFTSSYLRVSVKTHLCGIYSLISWSIFMLWGFPVHFHSCRILLQLVSPDLELVFLKAESPQPWKLHPLLERKGKEQPVKLGWWSFLPLWTSKKGGRV